MARKHGRKGRVFLGLAGPSAAAEPIAFLNKWTIDFSTDKLDVTAFGDNNKVKLSGLPDAKGTIAGFYDDATDQHYAAARDGEARKFYLYPSNDLNTQYFFGTVVADFSADGGVDTAVNVSGSWEAASDIQKVG